MDARELIDRRYSCRTCVAMCRFEMAARESGRSGRWAVEDPGITLPSPGIEYIATWRGSGRLPTSPVRVLWVCLWSGHLSCGAPVAYHCRAPATRGDTTSGSPRRIARAQNISRMCLVCGRDNPFGLHARFYELAPEEPAAAGAPAAGPELLGVFDVREEHQSYPGRLHGGISSTILDETIGRAILLLQPGAWGVTVEFNVRFRRPVPLDEEVRCVARISRDTSRLFEGAGEILLADGTVAVEGSGKYLKRSLESITDHDFIEREWFVDPRETPELADL